MGQFFAHFLPCNDIIFRLREIEIFLLPRCRKKGNLSGNNLMFDPIQKIDKLEKCPINQMYFLDNVEI